MGQTVWSGSGAGGQRISGSVAPGHPCVGPAAVFCRKKQGATGNIIAGGVPLDTPHFFDGAAGLPNADFATGSSVHVKSADHDASCLSSYQGK